MIATVTITNFGRPPESGRFPRRIPRHTLTLLLVSLAVGYAVGAYRYSQWNDLERYYLPAYIRSASAPLIGLTSGTYTIATGYQRSMRHTEFHEFLRRAVYQQTLSDIVRPSLYTAGVLFGLGLFFTVPRDMRRARERRQGMRRKGPEMVTVGEFNKRTAGDGLRISQNPIHTI